MLGNTSRVRAKDLPKHFKVKLVSLRNQVHKAMIDDRVSLADAAIRQLLIMKQHANDMLTMKEVVSRGGMKKRSMTPAERKLYRDEIVVIDRTLRLIRSEYLNMNWKWKF